MAGRFDENVKLIRTEQAHSKPPFITVQGGQY